MKIDRDKKSLGNYIPTSKTLTQGVKRGSETAFDQEMAYHKDDALQLQMQELLKEMDRVSERLNRNLNINDLMLYKKLVKNFLQEACTRAYTIKQQRGRNRRGRTLLITIDTIDTEVEELINDFMRKEKEPVEILKTMDKIRGMLIDLMV